jgi:hypothetical protein
MYHVGNGNAKIILTDLSIKLTRLIHKNNHMNNVASILILVFDLQSGYDKLFYWKIISNG